MKSDCYCYCCCGGGQFVCNLRPGMPLVDDGVRDRCDGHGKTAACVRMIGWIEIYADCYP